MVEYPFQPSDLTVVDVSDFIRRNQKMFFSSGSFSIPEATTRIAIEAMLCGARDVRIVLDGDWAIIYANTDWLQGATDDVFFQLEHFPEGGPNSARSEALLYTFSSRLIVATPLEVTVIKGGSQDLPSLSMNDWARAIAFAI